MALAVGAMGGHRQRSAVLFPRGVWIEDQQHLAFELEEDVATVGPGVRLDAEQAAVESFGGGEIARIEHGFEDRGRRHGFQGDRSFALGSGSAHRYARLAGMTSSAARRAPCG